MNKKCNKCGDVKPLDQFYKDKRKGDGLSNRCISCDHKLGKEKREKYKRLNKIEFPKLFPLTKKCAVCGEVKNSDEFIKDAGKKDG